jgi:hypothetical protein
MLFKFHVSIFVRPSAGLKLRNFHFAGKPSKMAKGHHAAA